MTLKQSWLERHWQLFTALLGASIIAAFVAASVTLTAQIGERNYVVTQLRHQDYTTCLRLNHVQAAARFALQDAKRRVGLTIPRNEPQYAISIALLNKEIVSLSPSACKETP
jgi:hypothetical protein